MKFKVLVVDDTSAKIAQIIDVLQIGNIERANIETAQTGIEALRQLQQNKFDLMVLDLALPFRAENQPSLKGGIELIEEYIKHSKYHKPTHVIGLTAYEDLKDESKNYFDERCWSLLSYSATNQWKRRLSEYVEYAESASKSLEDASYVTDLCIVTALPTPELQMVRQLNWNWSQALPMDSTTMVYRGTISINGQEFTVVAASSLRMGMVESALLTSKLIAKFRPQVVAMCGICAGVSNSVNIGDVILADATWDYQSGKRTISNSGSELSVAPDIISVSDNVISRFQELANRTNIWSDIENKWLGEKPTHSLRAKIGPIASGSSVAADGETIVEVREQHRKLLGIDMEIYGVYAASRAALIPKPMTFALKSVCDFADGQKDDKFQAYAAFTSAKALEALVETLLPYL